jgi:putative inorganic carbon (hco3(-)) transporter
MAELTWRARAVARPGSRVRHGDLLWVLLVGGTAALLLGWSLTVSIQAACALALVVAVIALHQYNRQWGIIALFAVWFLVPGVRRILGLTTGYVENDPLSLAPFLATGAIAALELLRVHVPRSTRRILLIAAGGFAVGFPVGLVTGPQSAVYAFVAYLAGVSGAVLGLGERVSVVASTMRRVLLFGIPAIAVYAILQRVLPLPAWDQEWIDATEFSSIGIKEDDKIRVFASLNSPGTLATLLGLSLLCFLTVHRARMATVAAAAVVAVALSLTFVRSAWVALIVAGVAHVVVSNGRSARLVFGSAALIVAATLALSPVSATADDVLDRFKSITDREDTSTTERKATFSETLPVAVQAPLGHGLGSAGEATKLTGDSVLRAPDNGYLGLIYQVGPIGFLLVMAAIAYVLRAAWDGARARAPGQELRQLLFAMLVFLLVLLTAGDEFYGSHGVIFWFIAGQVLAYDFRLRAADRQNEIRGSLTASR